MKQTSVHVQPVKPSSEKHNKREKELDYVRKDLTPTNEYWESRSQSEVLAEDKRLAKKLTGRKMQAKATPIREAVVVIDEHTTMDDLKKLADAYRQTFGIDCFQIAIHRDEGHKDKQGNWKQNLHAHMVFNWFNPLTGKSIKLMQGKHKAKDGTVFERDDMSRMQDIAAEVLHMGRGVSSDRKHLNAIQYKNQEQTKQLQEAQQSVARTKQTQIALAERNGELLDQSKQLESDISDTKRLQQQEENNLQVIQNAVRQQEAELQKNRKIAENARENAQIASKQREVINSQSKQINALKMRKTSLKAQNAGIRLWGTLKAATTVMLSTVGRVSAWVFDAFTIGSHKQKIAKLQDKAYAASKEAREWREIAIFDRTRNPDSQYKETVERLDEAMRTLKRVAPAEYARLDEVNHPHERKINISSQTRQALKPQTALGGWGKALKEHEEKQQEQEQKHEDKQQQEPRRRGGYHMH